LNIELHPLCTLFPRLAGAEFDALVADIRANGLRQPITRVNGMVLDGGNRYRACLAAGVEPTFVEFDGDNIVSFVLSANLHRRHLSAGQQAAIVASAQDWAKAQTVGRPEKGKIAPLATVGQRAATSGASLRTQKMADKVAKADPGLSAQVSRGEVSLPAAVEKVTGKRPGAKRAKPAADQNPIKNPVPPAEDDGAPTLEDLIDELQAENIKLTAEIQAAEADDLKAEAVKWRRIAANADRQLSEAMDKAARAEKREKFAMDQLRRCGRAVGVDDPSKIARAVEKAMAMKAVA
jgi:hypothetical protein